MAPPRFLLRLLAPQLSHPRGIGGRIVAALMNRNNRRMNAYTISALALAPGECVADIGFGGGLSLRALADRVGSGKVVGVEMSDAMIARANREQASLVNAGRLRIVKGTIESMPLDTDSVDAICTVNTVYFWKERDAAASELVRVLRTGGRVAITFLPKDAMQEIGFPTDVFRYTTPDEVMALLAGVGFRELRVDAAPDPGDRWCCVRGVLSEPG